MAQQQGAFDWDDQISKDSEFVLIPEGEYAFTVTAVERSYHNGSAKLPPCPKAIVHIRIDAPEGTTTIKNNLFLHPNCEGLLCAFFSSIGARKHGDTYKMDWEKADGATGRCVVGIREWTGNDGETRKSNEVKRFIEASVAQSEQTAPAARF